MAYSKTTVMQQLQASAEQINESLEYYKAFKQHLDECFPQPSADLPLNSKEYNQEVTRYAGLLQHTTQAIDSATNQLLDIDYHIKVLEMWR